jgi:hypothetical protein
MNMLFGQRSTGPGPQPLTSSGWSGADYQAAGKSFTCAAVIDSHQRLGYSFQAALAFAQLSPELFAGAEQHCREFMRAHRWQLLGQVADVIGRNIWTSGKSPGQGFADLQLANAAQADRLCLIRLPRGPLAWRPC